MKPHALEVTKYVHFERAGSIAVGIWERAVW